jgi:hypothetical protein
MNGGGLVTTENLGSFVPVNGTEPLGRSESSRMHIHMDILRNDSTVRCNFAHQLISRSDKQQQGSPRPINRTYSVPGLTQAPPLALAVSATGSGASLT